MGSGLGPMPWVTALHVDAVEAWGPGMMVGDAGLFLAHGSSLLF